MSAHFVDLANQVTNLPAERQIFRPWIPVLKFETRHKLIQEHSST